MITIGKNKPKSSGSGTRLEERRLVIGALRGEETAFEKIYYVHKNRIFALCLRLLGDYHQAEDMLQEAFLQAFRCLGQFRGDSSLGTWLYRVAANTVLSGMRRKGLEKAFLSEKTSEDGESSESETGVERESWKTLDLEQAIAALPDGYRMVLVLHDVEGWEHQEIAEVLGCTIGASKSQLHKARGRMRSLLPGY